MKKLNYLFVAILSMSFVSACSEDSKKDTKNNSSSSSQQSEPNKTTQSKGENNSQNESIAKVEMPQVEIKTSMGDIVVELNKKKAPLTVASFLSYVNDYAYSNTIFHRVDSTFVIQGGGFDTSLNKVASKEPIVSEANNGLSNITGTIAMARSSSPNSATNQFYINVNDNLSLDYQADSSGNVIKPGYTVFGKVVKGMDVVNKIKATPTSNKGGAFKNLPDTNVIIDSAKVIEK